MNSIAPNIEDALIAEAKTHFEASQSALRKSCKHALLTGLSLAALHSRTVGLGHGGDRRSSQSHVRLENGFSGACAEIGILERTARRWMNACAAALYRCGCIDHLADMRDGLPAPGTPVWEDWEAALTKVAEGMSLKRLLLGQVMDNTEEHRADLLITEAEDGSQAAEELLQKIADGKLTYAQARCAAAGALATKNKRRTDPVYLGYDAVEKRPVGLIPKAFVTLENGFAGWEDYDEDARAAMRSKWIEIVKVIPRELTELLRR